jgi:hypothetical protein
MPRLVDLSQEIYQGMPVYAGHLKTVIWQHHTHEDTAHKFDSGWSYQSLGLMLSDHGPTHVDAFSHLDTREDAPHIDEMPLEIFCGPATCLDISDLGPREYCDAARLDRALAESRSNCGRGTSSCCAPAPRSATAAPASTRPSIPVSTRPPPRGSASTGSRASAWTPRARTTPSALRTPAT